jgi:hypothetical protein
MAKMTISEMATVAGCSSPQGKDTDGAKWLREVQDAGEEMIRDLKDDFVKYPQDRVHEVADGQVPIYTNKLWNIWVDLGGYYFDGEYRDFSSNSDTGDMMNRVAQADCYEWAQNILFDMAQDAGVEM